jgi:hypothetical protein
MCMCIHSFHICMHAIYACSDVDALQILIIYLCIHSMHDIHINQWEKRKTLKCNSFVLFYWIVHSFHSLTHICVPKFITIHGLLPASNLLWFFQCF